MYILAMDTQKIFISDIFKSIQGEGPKIGTPSLFVRLGICNLQCKWCDTKYTWKKGLTDYKARSDEWIIGKLRNLNKNANIRNIVITGGEPLLQQNQLARLLADDFFKNIEIEFETNGSIKLQKPILTLIQKKQKPVTFNISPKLKDSGNKSYEIQTYPSSILKFVYVSKNSEKLINKFLMDYSNNTAKIPVFIMSEGTTVASMSKKYQNAIRYCTKQGFRLTPRLHIYLFGNSRAT